MRRVIAVFVLSLSLSSASVAEARRKPEGPPEPVVVAPEIDLETARRLAVAPAAEPIPLDVIVRAAVGGAARLYGADQLVPCASTVPAPDALDRVVADADAALLDLDHDRARTLLAAAAAGLGCSEHLVARAPLSSLFFLLGVSASYSGDREAAQRWFGQALAVSPNRSFDIDLAPQVYEQYLLAMERHYAGSPVPVTLALGAEEQAIIYLDGAEVDPALPPAPLGVGFHFLQFRQGDGPVVTFEFRVGEDDRIALATVDGALRATMQGPAAPEALRGVVDAVLGGAAKAGATGSVQLVTDRTVRRYFIEGARWETLREPPDRLTRIRNSGRTLLATGLSMFATGVTLSAVSALTAPVHPTHPDYPQALLVNRVGLTFVVVGLGVGGFGLPLVIAARPTKEARQAMERR